MWIFYHHSHVCHQKVVASFKDDKVMAKNSQLLHSVIHKRVAVKKHQDDFDDGDTISNVYNLSLQLSISILKGRSV